MFVKYIALKNQIIMKKLLLFFAGVLITGVSVSATTTTNSLDINAHASNTFIRNYDNSFIFVEQGVEFSVFRDGQFDFNVLNNGPRFSAYTDFDDVSISFNTGHSYDAYVQYDDYGAVVQIENIPIYYDYYGRIVRAGDVRIRYNNYGYVNRVGGLSYIIMHIIGILTVPDILTCLIDIMFIDLGTHTIVHH